MLVGRPRRSARLGETLLPKWLALPVFCSDPISSVAYATEQIVLVLSAGGLAALTLTPWVGLAVAVLLVVVVASYRQTCYAYPNGGGAFAVSRENLGESAALVILLFRAFASGCTALTGVEAISNGVPSFRKPKSRNAATTLTLMGTIAITMFGGITALAVALGTRAYPDGNPSVISQIAASVFGTLGADSVLFYLFQAATAGILILAANTAFNGFPVLAPILGQHRYLPRQLRNRGDRLVFSNGI
ncbi:MAG TPA: amino acid permease, partial [Pseudonocardiaceae bacterium]|nr:amino acid permease [Pseudonocardiaceae bacterium]